LLTRGVCRSLDSQWKYGCLNIPNSKLQTVKLAYCSPKE
jgi:hypothetical protein